MVRKIALILIGVFFFSSFWFLSTSKVQAQTRCKINSVNPAAGGENTLITLDVELVPNRKYTTRINLGGAGFFNISARDYFENKTKIPVRLSAAEEYNAIHDRLQRLYEEKKSKNEKLEYVGKIILWSPEGGNECETAFTFLLTPPTPPRTTPTSCQWPNDGQPVDHTTNFDGYQTAFGCIPTEAGGLMRWLLRWVISIAGGIAFLLILISAIVMTIGGSNPEGLKWANETLTNALVGLVFIILSVVLLRLIGVDILGIPGLGK